jgi:uncharacterized protein (DUF1778 family)
MKLTKRPLEKSFIFRLYERDLDLLRSAAAQKEISQSDFIRQAIKEKASRVLAGVENHLASEAGSMVILAGTSKKE